MAMVVNTEARRELGTSLMFIALILWVADLLVLFFFPAALKLGRATGFVAIIASLAGLGLFLMIWGFLARGKAEE